MTDLASACAAIEEILEQGEGPRGHWRNAHFGQFVNILDEDLRMRKANPAFDPVRPVIAASVRPHDCLDDVPLMLGVLKPLGSLITSMPAGPEYPGRTAGPSFELFYETDYLMPHREAAWALLAERLDEAAWLCSELRDGRRASIAAQLDPALDGLRGIAATLAAHLPAASPHAEIGARASLPAEAGIRSLASKCSEILNRTSGATSPDQGEAAWEELARAVNAARYHQAAAPGTSSWGGECGSDGEPGAGGIPGRDQLWEAVSAATRRRAELADGLDGCPPALAEAVAGLQDLAIRIASPGAFRVRRRAWPARPDRPPVLREARTRRPAARSGIRADASRPAATAGLLARAGARRSRRRRAEQ